MSSVLVTGCGGFFGANFTEYLCNLGYNVIGVDNLFGGYEDFVDERAIFYEFDLTDHELVRDLFVQHQDIDYIYHFAAYAAAGLSPFVRSFNYENNVVASANLINGAINHNISKFIFASSMEVYGTGHPPFQESDPLAPETPYGIAKLAVEQDLKSANLFHGLDYSIVRPHNVHGIYQNIWDPYRNVIGIFIRKALNDENLTIFGDGEQKRAFSNIRYYMEPLLKLMDVGSQEAYNIGAEEPVSVNEVARVVQHVAKQFGCNVDVEYHEPRKEVYEAYCAHEKARKELDFDDHTDLEHMVFEMFQWAYRQPVRPVKKLAYETSKRIYTYWQ